MNYFNILQKISDYIEIQWQNSPTDIITISSDNPRIADIDLKELNSTLIKMMSGDEVIEIVKSSEDQENATIVYTLKVFDGFSAYAEGARYNAKSNQDIALRLYLDDDLNPYLTGYILNFRKYKIFKSDHSKWLKDVISGLIFHTQNIPKLNLMEIKPYKPDDFMNQGGTDWHSMEKPEKDRYMSKSLPKEMFEQTKPYFFKLYGLFIHQEKNGIFKFRPAIPFSDVKKTEKRLGSDYQIIYTHAFQSSEILITE